MSTAFKERPVMSHQSERPGSLDIKRPSGQSFVREPVLPDAQGAIDDIDGAIAEYSLAPNQSTTLGIGALAVSGEVQLMSQAFPEQWDKAKERNARILGGAALCLANEQQATRPQEESLSYRLKAAFEGNEIAQATTATDAAAEVVEMGCKTGAKMTAIAEFANGQVMQYGRTTEERQRNTRTMYTYHFPALDGMSIVEGQNALSIETAIAEGKFKQGDTMVECSLVPDAVHALLKKSGLFLRDVTAIIRITTLGEDNQIIIDSYLVGGTDQRKLPQAETVRTAEAEDAVEQQALDNRFDIAAFRKLLHSLGVANTGDMSPTDMLSHPLYIPAEQGRKALDGTSLTMLYDDIAADIIGTPVMMGSVELYQKITQGVPRPLTREDYEAHFARMEKLQQNLRPLGQDVASQAAARWQEVAGDDYAAGRLIHKIAKRAVLDYLVKHIADEVSNRADPDVTPDFTAMGLETYNHYMDLRAALQRDDLVAANQALRLGEESARDTGCASGSRRLRKLVKDLLGIDTLDFEDDEKDDDDGLGPKIFKCKEGHINTRKWGELLTECQTKPCKEGSVGCDPKKPSRSTKRDRTRPVTPKSPKLPTLGAAKKRKTKQTSTKA